jgi:hypothetical protein
MRVKYHFMKVSVQNQNRPAGFLPHFSAPSRRRSLARDAARGLVQQMFFWGCDASHPEGNLLVRAGLQRLAREEPHGEGSSRYGMAWQSGLVELHSFCAGWYPGDPARTGTVFIRSRERLFPCTGGEPLVPGVYEDSRLGREGADDLLEALPPLFSWVCHYESRVRKLAGAGYRQKCWMRYWSKPGARPWLPPEDAVRWFRDFVRAPASIQRPREFLRRTSSL